MFKNNIQNYIIIVAGGSGQRMGESIPKQFLIIHQKPLLMLTIERFHQFHSALRIILVLPERQQAYWEELCRTFHFEIPHTIVHGGPTRFESVMNGLSVIDDVRGLTGVHDGVRPFVSDATIKNCFAQAKEHGAAIPTIPLVDSIRELSATGSLSRPRNSFRLVQTPQVFKTDLLKKAYQLPFRESFTDDASVVEAAGHTVYLTEGNTENIKITSPFDLLVARALSAQIKAGQNE
ncbi:2-C-methyl-D-erythritol 4-phosphate cytidylyltransferase [Geofilum rubicundum]|uniref:2-C-methyl-D-erythritol 4-phosphate cytidylyltransferase n=1 Tax=Geofilum rubicundum JCM 15548 TaxID=1236989 RepID=A0A0E9LUE9_9BACT|nr:2-C-methyl-D-erythritol 4-phosphate cytidylyltransferase [Geofilum rubicundum]GAO29217.1 2-C-methyl-D-erythritol 4-phosphate cytidylyltransferase [Geofilum rubicundum JCM 15548]